MVARKEKRKKSKTCDQSLSKINSCEKTKKEIKPTEVKRKKQTGRTVLTEIECESACVILSNPSAGSKRAREKEH